MGILDIVEKYRKGYCYYNGIDIEGKIKLGKLKLINIGKNIIRNVYVMNFF